jgi:transcriptional regulator with XRE-family HTH domain
MSQEELAFRAKVDRSYISLLENERYNPSVSVLARLAGALGVDLSVIVAAGADSKRKK